MKFYIPTSSLNMDNLLQSECILPMSHYAQRLTGYKFYEQIEELLPFDAIVLFKYPVQFTINDVGRYNYPVLIEFEDDVQTQDFYENEIQDGVCICSHNNAYFELLPYKYSSYELNIRRKIYPACYCRIHRAYSQLCNIYWFNHYAH